MKRRKSYYFKKGILCISSFENLYYLRVNFEAKSAHLDDLNQNLRDQQETELSL